MLSLAACRMCSPTAPSWSGLPIGTVSSPALFAPAQHRGALHALYAFNAEVTRVRDVAHAALPGEIRLQWWSEVISGERADEARANPVAAALLSTIERHQLSSATLIDLIEAHRFDLYDDPMASVDDLEAYTTRTSSALFALATQILAGTDAETVCLPAGIAYGVAGLLRAFPQHAAATSALCADGSSGASSGPLA